VTVVTIDRCDRTTAFDPEQSYDGHYQAATQSNTERF